MGISCGCPGDLSSYLIGLSLPATTFLGLDFEAGFLAGDLDAVFLVAADLAILKGLGKNTKKKYRFL